MRASTYAVKFPILRILPMIPYGVWQGGYLSITNVIFWCVTVCLGDMKGVKIDGIYFQIRVFQMR